MPAPFSNSTVVEICLTPDGFDISEFSQTAPDGLSFYDFSAAIEKDADGSERITKLTAEHLVLEPQTYGCTDDLSSFFLGPSKYGRLTLSRE